MPSQNVLFLCTGNSCRSQMAEGFARRMLDESFAVFSAGIERHGMNPYAVQVMAESGIDISEHYSKTINELPLQEFDYVITVCGHAHETCPVFPGNTKVIHRGFDDPPKLAAKFEDKEQILDCYRRVRDQIRDWIQCLPALLASDN